MVIYWKGTWSFGACVVETSCGYIFIYFSTIILRADNSLSLEIISDEFFFDVALGLKSSTIPVI